MKNALKMASKDPQKTIAKKYPCIQKQGGLEPSGQRLISLYSQTKKIAILTFLGYFFHTDLLLFTMF